MKQVARTRTIACPAQAVWDRLADFGGISAWAPNVDHSCLLSTAGDATGDAVGEAGEPGSGEDGRARLGAVRRIQTGRTVLLERVVTCEEPATIAYEIDGLPPIVRSVRNEWNLEPAGDDRTIVKLTSTIECGPRPPQQLIARIVGRRLAKESDSMLAGLTKSLEEPARA